MEYNRDSTPCEWIYYVPELRLTYIDDQGDNGYGEVIFKDSVLIEDCLDYGYLSGIRHANGRDWWVVVPKVRSNQFYTLLVTENGVEEVFLQTTGIPMNALDEHNEAVFSPDGRWYMRSNWEDKILFYSFDRCTGELTYNQRIAVPEFTDHENILGTAFSPNSRYLYAANVWEIYQYDTWVGDVESSGMLVAKYDGFWDQAPLFKTLFGYMSLAPDGRIYLSTGNTTHYLHYINKPNNRGVECDFRQRGIETPALTSFAIPNFPNYRLGALKGSACDTLGPEDPEEPAFRIYPNPFGENLSIELSSSLQEGLTFELYGVMGRKVYEGRIEPLDSRLDLELPQLSSGMYFYVIGSIEGDVIEEGKLVKR